MGGEGGHINNITMSETIQLECTTTVKRILGQTLKNSRVVCHALYFEEYVGY